jgi:pilus assembly protein CpaF
MEGEIITMRDLFAFDYRGERRDGTIEGEFRSTRLRPDFTARAARYGLDKELLEAVGVGGVLA